MSRTVKNPLKGTNEFLVTWAPNEKRLQVMLNYSVWCVLDLRHLRVCHVSLSLHSRSIAL